MGNNLVIISVRQFSNEFIYFVNLFIVNSLISTDNEGHT